uniref:AN1-type domain-containing protein n=1 Tax=viral metagenome TaxID=1070528 RepID=A0A6C0ETZ6_9ZZZZ
MNTAKHGCQNCRRKTIMTITCKCNMTVCITCRHPDNHKCTFDFQEEAKQKIIKENPVISGEKLERI